MGNRPLLTVLPGPSLALLAAADRLILAAVALTRRMVTDLHAVNETDLTDQAWDAALDQIDVAYAHSHDVAVAELETTWLPGGVGTGAVREAIAAGHEWRFKLRPGDSRLDTYGDELRQACGDAIEARYGEDATARLIDRHRATGATAWPPSRPDLRAVPEHPTAS